MSDKGFYASEMKRIYEAEQFQAEEIINHYAINPAWLGIELTESGMMIEEDE